MPSGFVLGVICLCALAVVLAVYVAFQKGILPRPVALVLSKAFFYPTLPLTALSPWFQSRPTFFSPLVEGVWFGAVPLVCLGQVEELSALGVRAVVNCCAEYGGPVKEYARRGMVQFHLPVVDHTEPSVLDMRRAVQFIRKQRLEGHGVYVHCKGGHGRSAAIAFAWLLTTTAMNPGQAQEFLNARRSVRRRLFEQPNVVEFCAQLRARNVNAHAEEGPEADERTPIIEHENS